MERTESARAVGLIETIGLVPLAAGIEAMVKTSDVECIAVQRVGSGYLSAAIEGTVAAVRQALNAGSAAVRQYGELLNAQFYPRPHQVSARLLENNTRQELTAPSPPAIGGGG